MKIVYKNFSGGEISGSLAARYDLEKFSSSCRHLENFIPELHGPLSRRMGSYFLEDLGAPAVLLPFEFSSDPAQNYVLVVQAGKIRVAQKNGFVLKNGVPVQVAAPYTVEQLYDISMAQSGDVVYLAHSAHALLRIERHGHTDWRVSPVNMMPDIAQPAWVTVGFSSSGDYPLHYKIAAVNSKGEISVATTGMQPNAKHPSDWVQGDYATITWAAVPGAESYNVYRQQAGVYGLIGVSTVTSFRDDKYAADSLDTPSEPQNPFVEGNNPSVVCFHQQRLVLGAPALEPQKWYCSRTGSYEDFARSRPLKDDDALEFTIASGRIDRIQWVASFGDLLIGTAGSEYKAIGADQGAITPSSLNVREQSYWGSVKLKPLIIGNSVLHVQRQGSRVRDLFYSLERDGYAGNDLSVLASHLFDNYLIRQWDYQQAQGSTVWAVRDDGIMLVLTYLKEHNIWGWSRITTEGKYLSVACTAGYLQDDLYTVVEREVNGGRKWFLERFMPRWNAGEDSLKDRVLEAAKAPVNGHEAEHGRIRYAFYVDCGLSYENPDYPISHVGGLDHLEGCRVAVLADGSPEPEQTVKDGKVVLSRPARVIHVGLPYTSIMCPQTPEADNPNSGGTLGRVRSYGQCSLNVLGSVTGQYGPAPGELYDIPSRPDFYDMPVPPDTGFVTFTPNCNFRPEGLIWFAQDKPLPFTIAAMVLDVDMHG